MDPSPVFVDPVFNDFIRKARFDGTPRTG